MSTDRLADDSHDDDGPAGDLGAASEAEQFWERHYRGREQVFSGNANRILVEVAGQLPAGTALDLGCGEGGDAIWLARQGWQVTAVDVAATALARAAENANTAGVADRINFEQHDLTRSQPAGAFDLVSAQYLQSPVAFPREQVLRSVAQAVAVGGLLLIVDHASVPPWSWADPDTRFPTPKQFLASLQLPGEQWQSQRLEAPSRQAAALAARAPPSPTTSSPSEGSRCDRQPTGTPNGSARGRPTDDSQYGSHPTRRGRPTGRSWQRRSARCRRGPCGRR